MIPICLLRESHSAGGSRATRSSATTRPGEIRRWRQCGGESNQRKLVNARIDAAFGIGKVWYDQRSHFTFATFAFRHFEPLRVRAVIGCERHESAAARSASSWGPGYAGPRAVKDSGGQHFQPCVMACRRAKCRFHDPRLHRNQTDDPIVLLRRRIGANHR